MSVIEISKKAFIADYLVMKVDDLKEKYGLNNYSYYKLVREFDLQAKKEKSEHKTIKVVD